MERLIAKAEYEYFQVRRDLMAVLEMAEAPAWRRAPEEALPTPPEAAEGRLRRARRAARQRFQVPAPF